ncbi:MAG: C-GCAxxG-C-C family protein [Solirubrobacterales bacterium]
MEKIEQAISYLTQGANCAQSVLLAFSEDLGITEDLALKIASGFGGGMCQGEVCGAVTGAMMVLSLKYGDSGIPDSETKEKIYHLIRSFSDEFKNKNGSINCSNLLGIDLQKEENRAVARENGLFKDNCSRFVENAVKILETLF